ncbi:hypothetical protein Tco_1284048 [Tanacetum coccineum]
MGFDFVIEYKLGVPNQVADTLSRMYEEDEGITASFMAMSRPSVGLVNDLKNENETLEELHQLHGKLDREERLDEFRREQGLMLYQVVIISEPKRNAKSSVDDFIRKCLVCQQTKYSTQATRGLLQPLPTPTAVWEEVSMYFITGLPTFKGLRHIIFMSRTGFLKYLHINRQALLEPKIQNHPQNAGINGAGQMTEVKGHS